MTASAPNTPQIPIRNDSNTHPGINGTLKSGESGEIQPQMRRTTGNDTRREIINAMMRDALRDRHHEDSDNTQALKVVKARRSMRQRFNEWLLTIPSLVMLLLLVGLPVLVVGIMSLRENTSYVGGPGGWTLEAWGCLIRSSMLKVITRTLWYATLSTVISVLIALPVAIYLARAPQRIRGLLILLVILPFWTNMLVHVCAWKVVLHPDGLLKSVLVSMGIISDQTSLLYNFTAVVILTVYIFVPFAILPLYAAVEKYDFRLLEAARDLGASRFTAFIRVFLPGIRHGIFSASVLVFVPVLGCYVVPSLMGGAANQMYANEIERATFTNRNLPEAAALSSALLIAMATALACGLFITHAARKISARKKQHLDPLEKRQGPLNLSSQITGTEGGVI